MAEEKSIGEKIVDLLCDGKTTKQIEAELGISHYALEDRLRKLQREVWLPNNKHVYRARKADILANVEKWKKYRDQVQELRKQFLDSLSRFEF
jgi:hypothetical protein